MGLLSPSGFFHIACTFDVNKIMIDESRFPKDILLEAGEEASADDQTVNEFDGLDLRYAMCFGYDCPRVKSWTNLAEIALDKGWSNIDVHQLENSLLHNVEACYYKIAQFKFENVNDDMSYLLWFDNNKGLWDICIKDSPDAELTIEQRADFFKSETFQKTAKQTYYFIANAKKVYEQIVKQHIENGEMIDVDVVKLDAILHWIDQQYFLDNILNGKYLNY